MKTQLSNLAGRGRRSVLLTALVAAALALPLSAALAQEAERAEEGKTVHVDTFASAMETEITTLHGDKQHTHGINEDTEVTLNGQPAEIEDLKQGDRVRLTILRRGNREIVTKIEARRSQDQEQVGQAEQRPERVVEEERQPPRRPRRPERPRADAEERGQAAERGRPAGRERRQTAALGVLVQAPREGRVLVAQVEPGTPADRAGLELGDEIVSVDGQEITSPEQLSNLIRQKEPGDELQIVVRREGEEQTVRATLVSRAEAFRPEGQTFAPEPRRPREGGQARGGQPEQAWLGVLLGPQPAGDDQQEGVVILDVRPGGPAARAGLRAGDVVIAVDGDEVTEAADLIAIIQEKQPGDQVRFGVVRDGEERQLNVTLGTAPDVLRGPGGTAGDFRDFGFSLPQLGPDHSLLLEQHRRLAEQHQRLESMVQQLLQEVREMRRELRGRQDESGDAGRRRSGRPAEAQ